MDPKKPDLEVRAEALLKRIQRYNLGRVSLTAVEVRRLLKEIRAIRKMSLAAALSHDVLSRVDIKMKQVVKEARNIVAGAQEHGTKNRTD